MEQTANTPSECNMESKGMLTLFPVRTRIQGHPATGNIVQETGSRELEELSANWHSKQTDQRNYPILIVLGSPIR